MLTLASLVDVMNRLGRAMADPTRSRILLSLLEQPGYPAKLARDLDLTRTNVSNHLACLRGCGIVVAEPEGRQTRYEIADPHLTAALTALGKAWEVQGAERQQFLTVYLQKHPYLEEFVTAPTCALLRIKVEKYIVVTRFQEVREITIPA